MGVKSVEGRINTGKYTLIREGDLLEFHTDSSSDSITKRVKCVSQYESFKEMLQDVGVEKCLPGVGSVKEGEIIYHGFPEYEKKAKEFGVLALFLENVSKK